MKIPDVRTLDLGRRGDVTPRKVILATWNSRKTIPPSPTIIALESAPDLWRTLVLATHPLTGRLGPGILRAHQLSKSSLSEIH